ACGLWMFLFLMFRLVPRCTPFPYTTLFRSVDELRHPPRALRSDAQSDLELVLRQLIAAEVDELVDEPLSVIALQRDVDQGREREDRKSTRLNSSHVKISYAVFCLKKKKLAH